MFVCIKAFNTVSTGGEEHHGACGASGLICKQAVRPHSRDISIFKSVSIVKSD